MKDKGIPKLPKKLEKLAKFAIKKVQPLEEMTRDGIVPFDSF